MHSENHWNCLQYSLCYAPLCLDYHYCSGLVEGVQKQIRIVYKFRQTAIRQATYLQWLDFDVC